MNSKYQIWIKQSDTGGANLREFRFPVLPEQITVGNDSYVERLKVQGLHEVVRVKCKNIKTISFSSELPSTYYAGCQFEDFLSPNDSLEKIEAMKDKGPVRLIITGTFINLEAVITKFKIWEAGGDVGTLNFDIQFDEYRRPKQRQISVNKGKTVVKSTPKRPSTKSVPPRYKVSSGDCLYTIAKAQLRDASRWPEIAKLNNIKSPYIIHPNQVLNLPK